MLTMSAMSTAFISGTNFRKHPVLIPEHENPQGFTPQRDRLRNLRLLGTPFSFRRDEVRKGKPRRKQLFEGHPPELRARMLARLQLRLDHWQAVRGKRPQPGEWLYAKIIAGLERGFKTFGAHPELAAICGRRGLGVGNFRKRLRRGRWQLMDYRYNPPKKSERSQGPRVSSTLGVV